MRERRLDGQRSTGEEALEIDGQREDDGERGGNGEHGREDRTTLP